jgi:hypothetical protein
MQWAGLIRRRRCDDRRVARPRIDPERLHKMQLMRAEGRSLKQIGAAVGLAPCTVHYHLGGRGTGPELVIGLDGRRRAGHRPHIAPKHCRWCGREHTGPTGYCRTSCEREQRRYRRFLATGRIPQRRAGQPG